MPNDALIDDWSPLQQRATTEKQTKASAQNESAYNRTERIQVTAHGASGWNVVCLALPFCPARSCSLLWVKDRNFEGSELGLWVG